MSRKNGAGSCECCGGCEVADHTPGTGWSGWTDPPVGGASGAVAPGITTSLSVNRPTGHWTVDIQVSNIAAFSGTEPTITVGDLLVSFAASSTAWTIKPQAACLNYTRLRSATPTGFWLRYQETTTGANNRRKRVTVFANDPSSASPTVLGFHCIEDPIEEDDELPEQVVITIASNNATVTVGNITSRGTRQDNAECPEVPVCVDCASGFLNPGNCPPLYYPFVELSNIPDTWTATIVETHPPCPSRNNCQPTETIVNSATYVISGLSQFNGTYTSGIFDIVVASNGTVSSATPACVGSPGCKWWGFSRMTANVTVTKFSTQVWNVGGSFQGNIFNSTTCAPAGQETLEQTFVVPVRFDPILGCTMPLVQQVNTPPQLQFFSQVLEFYPVATYGTGANRVRIPRNGSGGVPANPVTHNRTFQFAACATVRDPALYTDFSDSHNTLRAHPLDQDATIEDKRQQVGSLASQNAPFGFERAGQPTNFLGPGLLFGQIRPVDPNLVYNDGVVRQSNTMIFVNQAFRQHFLLSSDIVSTAVSSVRTYPFVTCEYTATETYGPFRVTRTFVPVSEGP